MTRYLHLVGSLPPEIATSDDAALRWPVDNAGDTPLTMLPCDIDAQWIIAWLAALDDVRDVEGNRVFEKVVAGAGDRYRTMTVYRMARGADGKRVALSPEHVSMRRTQRLRSITDKVRALRAQDDRWRHLSHQISLPNPLDLALFTFVGPPFLPDDPTPRLLQALPKLPSVVTALRALPVFAKATEAEVAELVRAEGADDIAFQLESPAVLIALELTPAPLRPLVSRLLARQVAQVIRRTPPGTQVVLHLCDGDLDNEPLVVPRDLRGAVGFLNRLAALLHTAGRALPDVHLPVAPGNHAPPADPRYYVALRRLDPAYRVIAGVGSEDHPKESFVAHAEFERALGRPAHAVAISCGSGRNTPAEAAAAMQVLRALATAGSDRADME